MRLTEESAERDTLVPCLACHGTEKRTVEYRDGSYRQFDCVWCSNGYMDKTTAKMFARWLRIRAANGCSQ